MRLSRPLARILVLTALFAVLAVVPALANTAQAAQAAQAAPQVASASAADFLAGLSADLSGVPGPVLASGCSSDSQCPNGQLCCLACGYFGCDTYACFQPIHGECPLFP
ncbi:MAG TPA: hypothetical protein VFE33_03395 [Thermoanaerobaculia bacterium]|nr:hypothetical protein [Thermoanaerobaculia bacterium]